MIESIKAINFQSLQNVDIELGKFTVIVGPSSSGKSALTRALKAVTSNQLNSDYITRGTKKSSVSLRTGDTTVTIERELGDSSVYKVASLGSQESRFARVNRQVPAEVTAALGIVPSTQEVASINFAGQFDTPYLLKEGASSVARVLGELTNVSTIFSAVKEASKRAKNSSTLVNLRKKDEQQLIQDLSKFINVGQSSKKISEAEILMAECTELARQVEILQGCVARAEDAVNALNSIKEIPEPPDLGQVLQAQKQLIEYKQILTTVALSQQQIKKSDSSIEDSETIIVSTEQELHNLLVKVGKCPTCNQNIPIR